MHLQSRPITTLRRTAGRLIVGALVLAGAGAVLVSRAQTPAPQYAIEATFQGAVKSFTSQLRAGEGETATALSIGAGPLFTAEIQVRKAQQAGAVQISMKIALDNVTVAEPVLVSQLGETARVRVDSARGPLEVSLLVNEQR